MAVGDYPVMKIIYKQAILVGAMLVCPVILYGCVLAVNLVLEHNRGPVAPEEEKIIEWILEMGGSGGLTKIGGKQHMVHVDLDGTNVSDDDLRRLAGLHYLRRLDLSRTRTTDAAVAILQQFQTLESIDVSYTAFTSEGLRQLGSQIASLKIVGCTGIPTEGCEKGASEEVAKPWPPTDD